MFAPTVEEIVRDRLTQLSLQYWAGAPDQLPFDPKIVEDIYTEELSAPNPFSRIMLLELAHYLEAYESPSPQFLFVPWVDLHATTSSTISFEHGLTNRWRYVI